MSRCRRIALLTYQTSSREIHSESGEWKKKCVVYIKKTEKGGFRFYGNDCEICLQLTFDNRQRRKIYRILMGLLHGIFTTHIFNELFLFVLVLLQSRQMWFLSLPPFKVRYCAERFFAPFLLCFFFFFFLSLISQGWIKSVFA